MAQEKIELVDLVIARGRRRLILRFLVDKPQGISLEECARLNRQLSKRLDQENIIQESYILEVSSPGLDRPLLNTRDFQRHQGELVRVVLHQPQDKENVYQGCIKQIDDSALIINTEKEQSIRIARENIARANLVIDD